MIPRTNAESLKSRLPCLDGLRAISIFFVLAAHVQSTLPHKIPRWLNLMIPRGDLGVFVFFVLSGFLITHLLQKEWLATGGISLRNFYLRRILRIFPAFYFFLLTLILLSAFGVLSIARSHFLDAGFFLWNYKQIWDPTLGQGNWFLGHFWTLSLEEQFYLLWPLSNWLCTHLLRLMTYCYLPVSCSLSYGLYTGQSIGKLFFGNIMPSFIRRPKVRDPSRPPIKSTTYLTLSSQSCPGGGNINKIRAFFNRLRHPLMPCLAISMSVVLVWNRPAFCDVDSSWRREKGGDLENANRLLKNNRWPGVQ